MKTLVILVALSIFVGLGVAQGPNPGPGHVGVGTIGRVIAEAAPVVCWFEGPMRENISVVCFSGGSDIPVYTNVFTVHPGPGQTGSLGGISWTLTEPASGQFN